MPAQTMPRQIVGLLLWIVIVFIAAGLGAVASVDAGSFYRQLVRPDWAPPAGVFGPVWTTLYMLMGIAAWRVWRTRGWVAARTPLVMFCVQLAINALWSWLFFGWHLGGWAFADVILLWGLIVVTLISFWRIDRLAGWLLLPYLLWVSFAAVLNYSVWQLNPQLL